MAIPFQQDENSQLSCAVLVDKGKRNGVQVQEFRINLMLCDFRVHHSERDIATTCRLMEMVAMRFQAYFDALESPQEGKDTYDTFVKDLIAAVNLEFREDGLIVRRFILGGWEVSVESLARMMGVELEGAVKH